MPNWCMIEQIDGGANMIRLFRKKIEKRCEYCTHSTLLDEDTVLCAKKGIRGNDDKCRKFHYDACKRVPVKPKALDFEKYNEYDYSL